MLKDEADVALARAASVASSRRSAPSPASGISSPAIIRSSVVLPEPDGPSSATSSPVGDLEADVVERDEAAEGFAQVADLDTHAASFQPVDGRRFDGGQWHSAASPPRQPFRDQRHQREQGQAVKRPQKKPQTR